MTTATQTAALSRADRDRFARVGDDELVIEWHIQKHIMFTWEIDIEALDKFVPEELTAVEVRPGGAAGKFHAHPFFKGMDLSRIRGCYRQMIPQPGSTAVERFYKTRALPRRGQKK